MQIICGWIRQGMFWCWMLKGAATLGLCSRTNEKMTPSSAKHFLPRKSVKRNDSSVHGVFPGDRNRAPVAQLRYQDPSDDDGSTPFVLPLCKDFCFELASTGGQRANRKNSTDRGPDLAHLISWWFDSGNGQEVCYSAHRSENMRYDPETRLYTYPSATCINTISNVGASNQSFYKKEVSLSARLHLTGSKEKASQQQLGHEAQKTVPIGTFSRLWIYLGVFYAEALTKADYNG